MRMRHIATVQHHASAVYIMPYTLSFTLLWPLHGCKVCPFTSLFITLYSKRYMQVYTARSTWWEYKSGAAGGERSEPPCLYIYISICVDTMSCIRQCRFDIVLVLLAGSKHVYKCQAPRDIFNSKDKANNKQQSIVIRYYLCMEGNETVWQF